MNPSQSSVLSQSSIANPSFSLPIAASHDIVTAISAAKQALHLAESTIKRVHEVFQSCGVPTANNGFCSCPFDRRHRMPPESLFRHFLVCSSSPGVVDLSILDWLWYPSSLTVPPQTQIFKPLEDRSTDLCFSLDDFGNFGLNFFYKDCPGVVSSTDRDRTFTLPALLALECGNFKSYRRGGMQDVLFLPSELVALKKELESWNDYPSSYSYIVLRAASSLGVIEQSSIKAWVIKNSPAYGIVIDAAMREHIFTLLNLCLKAIRRQAFDALESILNRDESSNLKNVAVGCPVSVQVLTWLSSQLSVLYGEASGKTFTLNMWKQCLLLVVSSSLLFPLRQKNTGNVGIERNDDACSLKAAKANVEEQRATSSSHEHENEPRIRINEIFISQVAAAVAALHERALLEMKIKELRFGRSLSKTQLLEEHSNASVRAIEERGKRTDYRPILEHDGLLWQRSKSQDSDKRKTKEELLAEERDYKRRRMSFRGKKAKRSPSEVLRDMIEEHMEEIRQAGGIGYFFNRAAETGSGQSGSIFIADITSVDESQTDSLDSLEGSRKQTHYKDEITKEVGDKYLKLRSRNRSDNRHEKDRVHRSKSPHGYLGEGFSHQRYKHEMYSGKVEMVGNKCGRDGSAASSHSKYAKDDTRVDKSDRLAKNDKHIYKSDRLTGSEKRDRGKFYLDRIGESDSQSAFEDRYDPLRTYDRYEDA